MKINKTDNSIEIFVPAGDGSFKFELRRIAIPYKDGGIRQNQDLWRLYELYLYDREGQNKIYDFPICNKGEWECALRIQDTPDFHGGFHGYEHAKSVTATVAEGEEAWVEEFRFVQESEIYLQGTRDTRIALHTKDYCFRDGKVTLRQKLVFDRELTMLFSYMGMLPIKRTSDDTPNGEQICDRLMVNEDGTVYDVSKEGHKLPFSTGAGFFRNLRSARLWGESSGITARMDLEGVVFPDNSFQISNADCYNKFYYSHAGDGAGHRILPGDVWELVSIYQIWQK
jgi:hypothetical protein